MPRFKNPIPQSQKNIVRQVARRAWRDTNGDHATAIILFDNLLRREIGAAWLPEGHELGHELIDHWAAEGISEPSAVYQRGEPGAGQEWDDA